MITLMISGLAVSGLAAGAVLGTRFDVFVLFPAMLVGVPLNVGIALVQGGGLWPTLLSLVLSITGLQLGFFVGGMAMQAREQPPLQPNGDIPTVEHDQCDQLVAARKRLDGMVPELIALSKQLAEQTAAPVNARDAQRPAGAASGSAR
jgi:hypothetical protein